MRKQFYLPRSYTKRFFWMQNFVNKVELYATQLGIDAATVQLLKADLAMVDWTVQMIEIFKSEQKGRVAFKDLFFDGVDGKSLVMLPTMPPVPTPPPPPLPSQGAFKRVAKLVQQIKTNKNYNEPMGKDMGIIGSEKSINWDNAYPILSAVAQADNVKINFKKEHSDGIKLYSKRAGENDFSFLSVVTRSPYHDDRPKLDPTRSEKREYYAVYLLEDAVMGLKGNVVSVVLQ